VRWHLSRTGYCAAQSSRALNSHRQPGIRLLCNLVIIGLGAFHSESRCFCRPWQRTFNIAANATRTILTGPSPTNQHPSTGSETKQPPSCRLLVPCAGRPRRTAINLQLLRRSPTVHPASRDQHLTLTPPMSHKAMRERLSARAGRRCRRGTRWVHLKNCT
jgi:hypothetical protein